MDASGSPNPVSEGEDATNDSADTVPVPPAVASVPVVGVGASAGGLEALERFFGGIPRGTGIAFVVVQHLDPTRTGMLASLLQKSTALIVVEASDAMPIVADRVYVIPPNRDLEVDGQVLRVRQRRAESGPRLSVDMLFRSLAQQRGPASIGVVLSGMGSDGALGLRAIKDAGGATFVQDPTTAAFEGMPRSAVDADVADVVATVDELPALVVAHVRRPIEPGSVEQHEEESAAPRTAEIDSVELAQIVELLRVTTGFDVSLYKRGTIIRRIERRMSLHQLVKLADYLRYLREHPAELGRLHRELMIGVTSFFRDAEVWTTLREEVLPTLFAAHPEGGTLRAWVPACSTGEEAYTLAMVFSEALDRLPPTPRYSLRIFATDIDGSAIERARAGVYPLGIAADVRPERLNRFFVRTATHYEVSKHLRQMVVFAPHDIIGEPPFTRLDIVTCRNLLIYLEPELQQRILPLLHYALRPGGILVLGIAETVGDATEQFVATFERLRIYRRRDNASVQPSRLLSYAPLGSRAISVPVGGRAVATATHATADGHVAHLQHSIERLLVQTYGPPAVLADHLGNVVYVSGRTGNYLEPPHGRANWNLLAMARDGLRLMLGRAFRRALASQHEEHLEGVRIEVNDSVHLVDVTVRPVHLDGTSGDHVLVTFEEQEPRVARAGESSSAAASSAGVDLVSELNAELETAYTELRAAYDDGQSTREELASLNEELQSTNEELQSINEELTISMEEMQSMNEELQTLNRELQDRVDELTLASDDMANLLDSTQIATLFLDAEVKVRRFTPRMSSLMNVLASDVGRPLTDLAWRVRYPELADDVAAALAAESAIMRDIEADDGRWFASRVMPYRTHEGQIDGVVLTFSEITEAKHLEERLRAGTDTG